MGLRWYSVGARVGLRWNSGVARVHDRVSSAARGGHAGPLSITVVEHSRQTLRAGAEQVQSRYRAGTPAVAQYVAPAACPI